MQPSASRGYLHEDYRYFHLRDAKAMEVEPHYHEFDKLMLFISGRVTYTVEGRTSRLRPFDVLLIGSGCIHSLKVEEGEPYERIIIWLRRDYLHDAQNHEHLHHCFDRCAESGQFLLRTTDSMEFRHLADKLEQALNEPGFGQKALAESYLVQLLIYLSRHLLQDAGEAPRLSADPRIEAIRQYINDNLAADLSIAALADRFYLSRSYLMHRFREISGTPLHRYVRQKRLLRASELIRSGMPVGKAAAAAGFADYSAFYRAYKSTFKTMPKDTAE